MGGGKRKQVLSIIIPVREPEPYLGFLIKEIDSVLNQNWLFEILVQREDGLTNAVVQGVKKSRGDIILVADSDGSHPPKYIPQMLEKFGEYNIVIGIKSVDERSFFRQLVTKGFTFIAGIILGIKIHDLSGFVLARKDLFLVVKPSNDFKFILPLIFLNRGVNICEIPIVHPDRSGGKSKADWKQAFKILKLIFKLRLGLY